MSEIRKSILLKAFNNCIAMMTPRVVTFTIFVIHVLITGHLGNFNQLTKLFYHLIQWTGAEAVFVTMTVFNNLRFTMSYGFQQSIALTAELYVSCKRIQVSFHDKTPLLLIFQFVV